MASSGRLDDAHLRSRCESPWQQVVFGLFSLCCLGVEALWVTGSGAVVSVYCGVGVCCGGSVSTDLLQQPLASLLRLLQKVNGAQCQQTRLLLLLAVGA